MEFMVEAKWTFWVHLVQDGCRSGLILGRKAEPVGRAEHSYFHLADGEGLRPNEQILRLCGDAIYQLHPRTDESTVFDLLRSCAIALDARAFPPDRIPIEEVFGPPEYYSKEAFRLFQPRDRSGRLRNPNSDLRRFLISQAVFEQSILLKGRTDTFLRSRARDFAVLMSHEVMPEEGLDYLEHARMFLAMDSSSSEPPQWFRKQGPLASDFEARMVHIREGILSDLTHLVLSTPFSVLEGPSATGKTVLVRNLAYNLFREGWVRTYCFDERPFDVDTLARAINSVRGIVILENIHRNVLGYQYLFPRLRTDDRRHVLFTTRVPLRDVQHSKHAPLDALPCLKCDPSEAEDPIIDLFAADHVGLEWTETHKHTMKVASGHNLWLLAYSLQGYIAAARRTDPQEWIGNAVRRDLRDLEMCGDPSAARYPEILLALSPLCMSELPTSQMYLVSKFGFDKEWLNAAVRRGEVIRKECPRNGVLYTLPHSALARAYWEHGNEYRCQMHLLEQEDFVYDYAMSHMPNGLNAVMLAEKEARSSLVHRLIETDQMRGIVDCERSLVAVTRLVNAFPEVLATKGIVDAVARHLNNASEVADIGVCLGSIYRRDHSSGCAVWSALDKPDLAAKLSREMNCDAVHECVAAIESVDRSAWKALYAMIDKRCIPDKVLGLPSVRDMVLFLDRLRIAEPGADLQVCRSVALIPFADKLKAAEDCEFVSRLVAMVFRADEARGWALWELIGEDVLANKLNGCHYLHSVACGIAAIFHASKACGDRLWDRIDKEGLLRLCTSSQDAAYEVYGIQLADGDVGNELISLCGEVMARAVAEVHKCVVNMQSVDVGDEE